MKELNNASYYGLFMSALILFLWISLYRGMKEHHDIIIFIILTVLVLVVSAIWYMVREIYKKLDNHKNE